MKVTIKDIAKKAGVSVTTVSNVINKKHNRVSENTIKIIEDIIKDSNYTPNMNARSLVRSSSNLIGLLYFSKSNGFDFNDPFVSEILSSIMQEAKKLGYFILVHSINDKSDINLIQNNWNFDGFIVVGVHTNDFPDINASLNKPTVYIDTYLNNINKKKIINDENILFVNSDDYIAGKKATQFLIDNNHQDIAFLSYEFSPNQISVIQQRYKAFVDTMHLNSLSTDSKTIFNNYELKKIYDKIDYFTAVVISADSLALQLIKYLRERNISEDQLPSIISFDNIMMVDLISPSLTTLHLNPKLKGLVAFNNLLSIISKKKPPNQFIEIESKIVIRDSVNQI